MRVCCLAIHFAFLASCGIIMDTRDPTVEARNVPPSTGRLWAIERYKLVQSQGGLTRL
jgi:hypothetical protein